jgi:hypothetical protein
VRIAGLSSILIAVGGLLFGAGIIATARLLPSNGGDAATKAFVDAKPPAMLTPVPGDVGPPPVAAVEPPSGPLRTLDHHPLDQTMRDRNGNAPKRDVTGDELRYLAADYDVIADDLRHQPDGTALGSDQIASMHRINPGIRVLRIVETLTSNDPSFTGIRPDDGSHSSWFLRDAAGEPVLAYGGNAGWDRQPDFAIDPANTDVRNAVAIRVHQFAMLGYDGVVLHGIMPALPPSLTAPPINAATGHSYTDEEWRDAVTGLIAAVRAIAPAATIFVDAATDDAGALPAVDGRMALDPE